MKKYYSNNFNLFFINMFNNTIFLLDMVLFHFLFLDTKILNWSNFSLKTKKSKCNQNIMKVSCQLWIKVDQGNY